MDSDEGDQPDGPHAEALDRVRADLARLPADPDSAPEVPPAVIARIGAALRASAPPRRSKSRCSVPSPTRRAQPDPAHAVRAPLPPLRRIGLVIGVGTALLAAGLGALMLLQRPASTPSTDVTANTITVASSRPAIPVSDDELRELLTAAPQLGPLADPERRAGCLRALGYTDPGAVLGARPFHVNGSPGVLLLVPGTAADLIVAVVVAPRCGPNNAAALTERHILRR